MEALMRFLKGRGKTRGANPKLIDECIYTPYNYTSKNERSHDPVQTYERRHSTGGDAIDVAQQRNDLADQHAAQQRSDLADQHGEEHNGRHNSANGSGNGSRIDSSDLIGSAVDDHDSIGEPNPDFDTQVHTPEVFLFDYGVVVIWGMTEIQEARFLKEIAKFETEKLAPDDVETEKFNFYYTKDYQARIYNDFITLRDKNNYMTKLAISHALAQSVKVS
jgi:uncharacterized Rmd1/YagE family protein